MDVRDGSAGLVGMWLEMSTRWGGAWRMRKSMSGAIDGGIGD